MTIERTILTTPETENTKAQPPKTEKEKTIEIGFPLIIIRTKRFAKFFDKLGAFRTSHYISWIFVALVPFIAGIALYLVVNSLIALLSNPAVGEITRDLGPQGILMIPGLNPMLPIVYGWIALVAAIAIHEGAHGIIARNVGFNVKSSGLLFFLIIPIGAFVDVDEEQIKKAKARPSLKVMAAGVGGNIVIGAICLMLLMVLVGGLSPAVNGVYINSVMEGMPAQEAGLMPRDVFISIDNVPINNNTDIQTIIGNKTAGDTVLVEVMRGDNWQQQYSTNVTLTISDNRTIMGITTQNLQTEARLENYQTMSIERITMYIVPPTLAAGVVPYSDSLSPFYTHAIGPSWAIVANTLFWLWFVNLNLAIFNALPIYPMDGGRILDIALKRLMGNRLSEKTIRRITLSVTLLCVALIISTIALPFILPYIL
ncbi:MAG: site-2 protease family protein [Nitrososphaerota archaeon]|nr:site-2 protease family protein [Nitrososphaerota archaeon]